MNIQLQAANRSQHKLDPSHANWIDLTRSVTKENVGARAVVLQIRLSPKRNR